MKRSFAGWPLISSVAVLLVMIAPRPAIATQHGSANAATIQATAPREGAPPSERRIILPDGLWLSDEETLEQSESPRKYSVQVHRPLLDGGPQATANGFNQAIEALVASPVEEFRGAVTDLRALSYPDGPGSFLTVDYAVSTANSRIVSLFVGVNGYVEGAAHPYHLSYGLTYDLVEGRALDLADLFVAGSDYLPRLADDAISQLAPRLGDAGFFREGAEPRAENYRNWNLASDALVIEFNEYEVAPYAAGPQSIAIPYAALDDLLRHDDRLASVRDR